MTTQPRAGGGSSTALSNIPQWEADQLASLAAAGQLSGLDPNILAAIDSAESSGQGGSINSSGFGGYFGLQAGGSYPAGTATTTMLQGTNATAFDQQAVLSASDFNNMLIKAQGNLAQAEYWYQNGPNAGKIGSGGTMEGVKVFNQLGVTGTAVPGKTLGGGPLATQGASGAFASFLQQLDGFLNPTVSNFNIPLVGSALNGTSGVLLEVVDRGLGISFGIILIYLGIKMVGGMDGGGIGGVLNPVSRIVYAKERTKAENARSQSNLQVAAQRSASDIYRADAATRQQAAKSATDAYVAAQRVQAAKASANKTITRNSNRTSHIYHHTTPKPKSSKKP